MGRGREVWQQRQQQLLLKVHLLLLRQLWQLWQQHLVAAAVLEQQQLQVAEGQQQPVGQLAVLQASSAADFAEQQVGQLLELELLDQVEELVEVELAGLPVGAGLALLQAERARLPSADGTLPEGGKGYTSCISTLRSLYREILPRLNCFTCAG